ncbi:MAG: VTT domain-containing protein [Bacteroidales bacterium]|nr:VTT domain-containing protein [Bacteroidales bacterium]
METITDFFDLLIHSDKLIRVGGLALLLLIVYLETGVFFGFIFAGDALLFSAGLLCGPDLLDVNIFVLLFLVTAAAIAGNLTGYYTGKFLGKKLHTKQDSWFFKKRHLEKTRLFYDKYGGMSLVAGRFVWIVRTFAPILAGASDMGFRRFNLFNILGAFLWVWTIIPLGYLAGYLIPNATENLEYFVLAITLIATAILVRGIYNVSRRKNERSNS